MPLPSLASVDQLGTWLKTTIDEEDARALEVLSAASGLVRAITGQTWVDEEGDLTEVPSVAVTVTLMSASRAWLNPAGASDQRTGPFGASWAKGAAGVMLTEEERSMLSGISGGVSGLSSIRVVAPARAAGSRWLNTWREEDDE